MKGTIKKHQYFIISMIVAFIVSLIAYQEASAEVVEVESSSEVLVNKQWAITFNSFVDASTINSNTVYVQDANRNKVNTDIIVEENVVKLSPPAGGYIEGSVYTLYVTDEIKDFEGNSITNGVAKTFMTAMPEAANLAVANSVVTLPEEDLLSDVTQFDYNPTDKTEDMTVTKTFGESLTVGKFILVKPSSRYPEGFVRKVDSIVPNGETVILETSMPYLEDVVATLDLNKELNVSANDLKTNTNNVTVQDFSEYNRTTQSWTEGVDFLLDNFPMEQEGRILFLTGRIRMENPRIKPVIKDFPSTKNMSFTFSANVITQLAIEYELGLPLPKKFTFAEKSKDLADIEIPIPDMPTVTIGGSIGGIIKPSVYGGFSSTIANSTYFEVGFVKTGDNLSPIRKFSNDTTISSKGYGGIEMKFGFRAALHLSALKIKLVQVSNDVGPYILGEYVQGKVNTTGETLQCGRLEVGAFHDISLSFPALKKFSLLTTRNFYNAQLPIAEVSNCGVLQGIEFSKDEITIASGDRSSIYVTAKSFDIASQAMDYETITSDVTFASSNPNVVIANNGKIYVKGLSLADQATITATYSKDGKTFTDTLLINITEDPSLPDFNGSKVVGVAYKANYVLTNNTSTGKIIRFPIKGDVIFYRSNGSLDYMYTDESLLYLGAGEKVIVSFREDVKIAPVEGISIESSATPALHNIYMAGGAVRITNTSNDTIRLNIGNQQYSYVVYDATGAMDYYRYIDSGIGSIYLRPGGSTVISAVDGSLVNIKTPFNESNYVAQTEQALSQVTLQPNESKAIYSNTGQEVKFSINGKDGLYDYVNFSDSASNKVANVGYKSKVFSWDPSYYVNAMGKFVVTNSGDRAITIYAPVNMLRFEESEVALDILEVKDIENVKITNLLADQQTHVFIRGKGTYDVAHYNDKTMTSIDTYKMDNIIYSWDPSEDISRNGVSIFTNHIGNAAVTIYAPKGFVSFETATEPALDKILVPSKQTVVIENSQDHSATVKVSGEGYYDLVRYSDYATKRVKGFESKNLIFTWHRIEDILANGAISIENTNDIPMLVFAPKNYLTYTIKEEKLLNYTMIEPGNGVLIKNASNDTRSYKIISTVASNYEIVRYADHSLKDIKSYTPDATAYSWASIGDVSANASTVIRNVGDTVMTVFVVVNDLEVSPYNDTILEKYTLSAGQSYKFHNLSAYSMDIKYQGQGTFMAAEYSSGDSVNASITVNARLYNWLSTNTVAANSEFVMTSNSESSATIYVPVGVFNVSDSMPALNVITLAPGETTTLTNIHAEKSQTIQLYSIDNQSGSYSYKLSTSDQTVTKTIPTYGTSLSIGNGSRVSITNTGAQSIRLYMAANSFK